MAIRVGYVVKESVSNLRRNVLMTVTALLTVTISLGIVGAALLLRQGMDNYTIQFRSGIQLNVYMKPEATADQLAAVKREVEQLKSSGQVKSWTFVDKQAAFEEIKVLFSNDPESRDLFTSADQAPTSFRMTPKVAETIDTLGQRFEKREGVLQVRSNEAIKTLLRITRVIQYTLLGVALALLVAAVLLILNTIQLAIFSRRREVAVMKLVGATNWFIRLPFMLEGLLQGLLGALVAFAAVYVGSDRIQSAIRNSPAGLFKQFSVSSGQIVGTGVFILLVGALVGAIGSALAVSRFLDV